MDWANRTPPPLGKTNPEEGELSEKELVVRDTTDRVNSTGSLPHPNTCHRHKAVAATLGPLSSR